MSIQHSSEVLVLACFQSLPRGRAHIEVTVHVQVHNYRHYIWGLVSLVGEVTIEIYATRSPLSVRTYGK